MNSRWFVFAFAALALLPSLAGATTESWYYQIASSEWNGAVTNALYRLDLNASTINFSTCNSTTAFTILKETSGSLDGLVDYQLTAYNSTSGTATLYVRTDIAASNGTKIIVFCDSNQITQTNNSAKTFAGVTAFYTGGTTNALNASADWIIPGWTGAQPFTAVSGSNCPFAGQCVNVTNNTAYLRPYSNIALTTSQYIVAARFIPWKSLETGTFRSLIWGQRTNLFIGLSTGEGTEPCGTTEFGTWHYVGAGGVCAQTLASNIGIGKTYSVAGIWNSTATSLVVNGRFNETRAAASLVVADNWALGAEYTSARSLLGYVTDAMLIQPITVDMNATQWLQAWTDANHFAAYGTYSLGSSYAYPCSLTSPEVAFVFQFKDEETLAPMNVSMVATFTLKNATGQNVSSSGLSWTNTTQAAVCIHNTTAVAVDSFQAYYSNYGSTTYPQRNFFLRNASITPANTIDLYLLQSSLASQTIFRVANLNNRPVEGVVVRIQRFYPGTNTYVAIANVLTDFEGRGTTYLRANDAYYRFVLEQNAVTIHTVNPTTIVCVAGTCPPYAVNIQIDTGTTAAYWQQIGQISAACSYNNATFNITCTYTDASGLMRLANLTASKRQALSYTQECSTTCASNSCSLVCSLGNATNVSSSFYYYTLVIYDANGLPQTIFADYIDLTNGVIAWGSAGLFLTLVTVLMLAGAGVWNPVVAIVLSVLSLIFAGFTGMSPIGQGAIMALIIAAVLAAWKMRA